MNIEFKHVAAVSRTVATATATVIVLLILILFEVALAPRAMLCQMQQGGVMQCLIVRAVKQP